MSTFRGSKLRDAFRMLNQRQLAPAVAPQPVRRGPLKLTEVKLLSELTGVGPDPSAPLVFGVDHAPAGDSPSGAGEFGSGQALLVESNPTDAEDDDFDPSRVLGFSDEGLGSEPPSPPLLMAVWEMAHDTLSEAPDEDYGEDADADAVDPGVLSRGQTATVDFWAGVRGQALVRAWDGGPLATALGSWLAAQFPNLYGADSLNHVAGKPNTYVAALCRRLRRLKDRCASAQVLATALSIYATTEALGGTQAAPCDFLVTALGVGESLCNVGPAGAAFGVQPNSTLTVLQLVQALDEGSPRGVLLGDAPQPLRQARWLLERVNRFGGIDDGL